MRKSLVILLLSIVILTVNLGHAAGKNNFLAPLAQSFRLLSEQTVLDQESGLVWLRRDDGILRNWQSAAEYCASLQLDNRQWRLPERAELLSLVDYSRSDPAIDLTYFPDTRSFNYWAATPYTGAIGHVWSILFSEGAAYCSLREVENYTRCVSRHESS